jgi:magnesium transporter
VIEVVYERGGEAPFRWLDVTAPDPKELEALAREHGFHPLSVADCLEPGHLPKLEKIEGTTFVLLRAFDESAPESRRYRPGLTRKIAVPARRSRDDPSRAAPGSSCSRQRACGEPQ